jgi:hypothetical protein
MKYPSRSEYCSAIRNPQFAFRKKDPQTKIERDLDASLVTGQAIERIKPNGTKDIWSAAGSFAIAFKFATSSPHKIWAIRCFYRSNFEVKHHYKQALVRLKNSSCRDYFVDFTFLEEGIRVQGDCYPILKMEWVEGENLKKFIKANLGKRNVLLSLAERWRELCKNLCDAGIAHGDLQHGNVLIVKSFHQFTLKLIDYDSLYFSGDRTSIDDNIKGLPDYQHPLRKSLEKRCLEVDFFPQLAIYLSILALAEDKKLWETYQLDIREGLLFSRADFQNPDLADIFKSLAQLPEPIPELARKFKKICQLKNFRDIPSLETVLSNEQWLESHHNSSPYRQHSSSSQLLDSIVFWLKERSPQPPFLRGAMRERPEAREEDKSEPAVKITAPQSEIKPIPSLPQSPKRIAGWDPRSLKADYVKYLQPVNSIHTAGTKISLIPTQIQTVVKQKTEVFLTSVNSTKDNFKQKTEVVLNSVNNTKDNLLKAHHSVESNIAVQLRNLNSKIVNAIAAVNDKLEQINRLQIQTNPVTQPPKLIDRSPLQDLRTSDSAISLTNVLDSSPPIHNGVQDSSPSFQGEQGGIEISDSETQIPAINQPKTQTTAEVAAQLGYSLSWCHAQRYQHPYRFLSDTHYYKDAAGVVHWTEAGIEQLRCLKSQKKLAGIPANSLPTKEVSRRLGVSPEWLTKTKAKYATQFVAEIHYHTDARKRYYWTPTGIELLQQLLDEHKPLVVNRC